jgi:hypothetical protein
VKRKLILTLGVAAALSAVSLVHASAQSTHKQNAYGMSAAAPVSASQTRTGKPAAAAGQTQTAGFSQLTEQECRNLGGAVHTAPQCKTTQQRCVIRLASGQINAPCIDEVETKKN